MRLLLLPIAIQAALFGNDPCVGPKPDLVWTATPLRQVLEDVELHFCRRSIPARRDFRIIVPDAYLDTPVSLDYSGFTHYEVARALSIELGLQHSFRAWRIERKKGDPGWKRVQPILDPTPGLFRVRPSSTLIESELHQPWCDRSFCWCGVISDAEASQVPLPEVTQVLSRALTSFGGRGGPSRPRKHFAPGLHAGETGRARDFVIGLISSGLLDAFEDGPSVGGGFLRYQIGSLEESDRRPLLVGVAELPASVITSLQEGFRDDERTCGKGPDEFTLSLRTNYLEALLTTPKVHSLYRTLLGPRTDRSDEIVEQLFEDLRRALDGLKGPWVEPSPSWLGKSKPGFLYQACGEFHLGTGFWNCTDRGEPAVRVFDTP